MTQSPIERIETLTVGTVEYVSPDEVRILLNTEAPAFVALNAGSPRTFPRVNGYVLVQVENGYLVGLIQWITAEGMPYRSWGRAPELGLLNVPHPIRRLSISPMGTLRAVKRGDNDSTRYRFDRGSFVLPTVGDHVLIPTREQLLSIVESWPPRPITIGTSPLAGNATISVDPDRLFGRHLAVLGTTGSGKSCTVAGLIRWCLEAAANHMGERQNCCSKESGAIRTEPNARFIILDPNGEYERAFNEDSGYLKPRIFKVGGDNNARSLQVPLWFWNTSEWAAFAQASDKTQRPTLVYALRSLRDTKGNTLAERDPHGLRRFLGIVVRSIEINIANGAPFAPFPRPKGFREAMEKWTESLESEAVPPEKCPRLAQFIEYSRSLIEPRRVKNADQTFTTQQIAELHQKALEAYYESGGSTDELLPVDPDLPIEFSIDALIQTVEASASMLNVLEHAETMLIRIKSLLSDSRIKPIIRDVTGVTLEGWLNSYVGSDAADEGAIAILDLSLVPTEIVHIITSVVARVIFEALQRYRKLHDDKKPLPTVLVMEEAHTFVKKIRETSERETSADICTRIFEKIAREGRKFGLGLVISSQRPSELSPTILSQCNTYILHRITNDRDQELVSRFVPDNFRGLLRELPILSSQYAIVLGWATELPVLVKVKDLPQDQRPQSDDPDFWSVWTREVERDVNWVKIAEDWRTGARDSAVTEEANTKEDSELRPPF